MNSPRTKLYRDKHNGKLMGVCAGIAEYTGVDAFWIRLGMVALVIAQGWPLFLYLAMGFILNKSPQRTAREIRASFRDIDRRLASVEAHYVTSNPRLTAEIERLR